MRQLPNLVKDHMVAARLLTRKHATGRTAAGEPLSISASVRMVGNSVSPPPLAAIARANLDQVTAQEALAA